MFVLLNFGNWSKFKTDGREEGYIEKGKWKEKEEWEEESGGEGGEIGREEMCD